MRKSLKEVLSYHATIIYNTTSYRNLLLADLIYSYVHKYDDLSILKQDLNNIKDILNIRIDVNAVLELLKAKNYNKRVIPVK